MAGRSVLARAVAERGSVDGLILRHDAMRAGLSDDDIHRLVRSGHWMLLQHGIYAVGQPSAQLRARAAVRAAPVPSAVASHQTAAFVHGVPVIKGVVDAGSHPTTPRQEITVGSGHRRIEHVTVARAARRSRRAGLRIHAHDLAPEDMCCRGGVPLTTVGRTVFDLLREQSGALGLWSAEQALAGGLVTASEIDERLRHARHVPGIAAVRRTWALADPRSESPLETITRLVLIDGGLPRPEAQIAVSDRVSGQVLYRIDLGWEERRLGIECDGTAVHGAPNALYADRRRQNALQLRGWRILRVTWYDVTRRPSYVVWLVRRALADAA